jgi:hypothetical protein
VPENKGQWLSQLLSTISAAGAGITSLMAEISLPGVKADVKDCVLSGTVYSVMF